MSIPRDLGPSRERLSAAYGSSVTESSTLEAGPLGRAARVELLQAVADPVRWAVLEELGDATRCVCDLRERVPVPANLLSYHLKVLREAGLVTATRRGRWIDYTLAADALERMREALPAALPAAPEAVRECARGEAAP